MSRQSLTVGDLVEAGVANIQTGPFGTQLKASDYVEEGTPVINVRNIGFGDLKPEKFEFVNDETAERLATHLLQRQDIVFGRKGAVDRHLFVGEEQENWLQGSDCIRLRFSTDAIVPRFISYLFLTDAHQKWMLAQSGNKATMASLNHDIIKRIPLRIPTPTVQRGIADILSTYDDLIENNQRRMALLEEAARQLYREWFVRLRFPGHEHTHITDGVPEGWEKTNASQAMSILSGGTPRTSVPDFWDGDIPFYTPKDAGDYCYVLETERGVTELGLKNCNSRLYPKDTIFISARGTVGKLNLAYQPMAMSQSCYALVGRGHVSQFFLYCALRESIEHLKQHAVGAVFNAIVVDTFKRIPFLMPDAKNVKLFEETVAPMLNQIGNLIQQNQKLRAAHDLLLPRLMSGEIAV
jgi:type I restriction enzyme S subunit